MRRTVLSIAQGTFSSAAIGELRTVLVNLEIKVVPVQENGEVVADPDKEKLPVDVEGKVE